MVENKYYERKIKYLDLLENGERVGGAGFVKTEVRGMDVSLSCTVRGLHPTDTYEREVMLQDGDGESTVGRISLKEGQGQFTYHAVMDYSRLRRLRIVLGGTREISCSWQEDKKAPAGRDNTATGNEAADDDTARRDTDERREKKKNQEIQVISWNEIKAAEESLERVKNMMSSQAEDGKRDIPARETERMLSRDTGGIEKETWDGSTGMEEKNAGGPAKEEKRKITREQSAERRPDKAAQRVSSGRASGREKRPVRLMEDKWQQIWAIYPHIQPFQDEREYLSISPADFVLLSGEAYRAANNSFLLHGYYNYDHLILTRFEKRGEVTYYIGVPGNYYEREKQVAVMFGFESFECGTEPAQAGDFGYYMMQTQL